LAVIVVSKGALRVGPGEVAVFALDGGEQMSALRSYPVADQGPGESPAQLEVKVPAVPVDLQESVSDLGSIHNLQPFDLSVVEVFEQDEILRPLGQQRILFHGQPGSGVV
jgi:hypothetical protein